MQRYERIFNPRGRWIAIAITAVIAVVLFAIDLRSGPRINLPIFYPPLLLATLWWRDRRVLWLWAAILTAMTYTETFLHWKHHAIDPFILTNRSLVAVLILFMAFILHVMLHMWVVIGREQHELDQRNADLERVNQTINAERLRFAAVLRTAPIGMAVANRDLSSVRLNPAGAAMLGLADDADVALSRDADAWMIYRAGKPVMTADWPLSRAVNTGTEVHGDEVEMVIKGTRRLVLLVSAAPIRDLTGQVTGAVSAFMDVSEMKSLNRELDRRRRDAEEAAERKSRFLAAVSHDVRTPVNAINLLAELIQRTAAAGAARHGEVVELADEIKSSAAALVILVSDVLDVTRMDRGAISLVESDFWLDEALAEEIRQLMPLARDKGLDLTIVEPESQAPSSTTPTPPERIRLHADRVKLGRIISNLVGNAIKFTPRGSVWLAVRPREDGGVQMSVKDTGVGIAPSELERVFDEFHQLRNPNRDRAKGTGLGLSISKHLVEAMGGAIAVSSTLGEGTEFTVSLPASAVIPSPAGTPA